MSTAKRSAKVDIFRSLLKQLEGAHEAEVSLLRSQNEELKQEKEALVGKLQEVERPLSNPEEEYEDSQEDVVLKPTCKGCYDLELVSPISACQSRCGTPGEKQDSPWWSPRSVGREGDRQQMPPVQGEPVSVPRGSLHSSAGKVAATVSYDDPDAACKRDLERLQFPPAPIWSPLAEGSTLSPTNWVHSTTTSWRQEQKYLDADDMFTRRTRRCISYPGSTSRLVIECLGGLLILYDLINVPMLIAFNPPPTLIGQLLEYFTLIWWTLSVPASLTAGYIEHGETVMDPERIFWHYLKTWFAVDIAVVVPEWVFLIVREYTGSSASIAGSSMKLIRIMRFIRLVRLLRLPRLQGMLQLINDSIDSELLGIVVNIGKMLLMLAVINHVIACAWFMIGDASDCHGSPRWGCSWLEHFGYDNVTWEHQYAVSFHWSITQFTPASMHVVPVSLSERVFTIFVVLFALVAFSYVVGSITSSLSQLRSMQENTAKQFWLLRRYLKQERVSKVMAARIQRFLEHKWARQCESVQQKQVGLLALLSEQLSMELRSEIVLPQITVVPLFKHLEHMSRVTVHRLANQAVTQHSLALKDTIFHAREVARRMSILSHGELEYMQVMNSDGEVFQQVVTSSEDWIAEPVLWTSSWHHCGELTAAKESELLQIHPAKFVHCVRLNPEVLELTRLYAMNFLEWLNTEPQVRLTDIMRGSEVAGQAWSFLRPGQWKRPSASSMRTGAGG